MAIPWGPIVSGGLGLLGGLFGGGRDEEQRTQTRQQLPTWSPEQLPYLFGGSTWQPEMPLMNPYAVNYAGGLSAGYNPAFGPQQPMDFASLLGGMGGVPETPWFMGPGAAPQAGGLAALLGIGAGGPPPLLMNAPQFGFGVANPDLLHNQPGQSLVPSEPTPEVPQLQGPAPLNIDDIARQLAQRERAKEDMQTLLGGSSPRYRGRDLSGYFLDYDSMTEGERRAHRARNRRY